MAAVDQAQASSAATPATWQTHVLRASDGSHYVALSAVARDIPAPKDAVLLYVRLATRRTAADRTSVRSVAGSPKRGSCCVNVV